MLCFVYHATFTGVLRKTLEDLADEKHYFFRTSDFYPLFPGMSVEALRMLLGRTVKAGALRRFCRGLYLCPGAGYRKGCELYHAASRLREESFCYLSLVALNDMCAARRPMDLVAPEAAHEFA